MGISFRSFSAEPLPEQVLSNLVWAAFGVNRPESGRRTAPSAQNWQEIDVYVVMGNGTYVYDAKAHALMPVVSGDLRALTGKQVGGHILFTAVTIESEAPAWTALGLAPMAPLPQCQR